MGDALTLSHAATSPLIAGDEDGADGATAMLCGEAAHGDTGFIRFNSLGDGIED